MSLTSLISTLEAYKNAAEHKFISDLVPPEYQKIITEREAGPETIASLIMSDIKKEDELEYNDIVDLKMILIVICRGFDVADYDIGDYESLNALYTRAYSA